MVVLRYGFEAGCRYVLRASSSRINHFENIDVFADRCRLRIDKLLARHVCPPGTNSVLSPGRHVQIIDYRLSLSQSSRLVLSTYSTSSSDPAIRNARRNSNNLNASIPFVNPHVDSYRDGRSVAASQSP
jgi:hypothetical protein